MKKILVINRKNTDNLGDVAINYSMKKLIEKTGMNCSDEDFTNYHLSGFIDTKTISKKNVEKRSGLKCFIKKLISNSFLGKYIWLRKNTYLFNILQKESFDVLFIGGGELIQSNKVFPTALYWWTKYASRYGVKKICLFAVGVTNKWSNQDKRLVKKSLNKVDAIYVRDETSLKNLCKEFERKASVVPDVVFINDIQTINKREYILYGLTNYERLIKHESGFTNKEEYYHSSFDNIIHIEKELNRKTILFYTTRKDYDTCCDFNDYCQKNYNIEFVIASISSLDDLKRYISEAAVVCSPRMHGCIIGKIYSKDVRPIIISEKMKSFVSHYQDLDVTKSICYQNTLLEAVKNILL